MKSFTALLLLVLSSCFPLWKDDELQLLKKNNESNKLRLNGYYFEKAKSRNGHIYSIHFFYRNGIMHFAGNLDSLQYDALPAFLQQPNVQRFRRDDKTKWGLYQIKEDSILFERWYHSGGPPLVVIRSKGIILNDSTFIIDPHTYILNEQEITEADTFHFKKFFPKPDSLNRFVPGSPKNNAN